MNGKLMLIQVRVCVVKFQATTRGKVNPDICSNSVALGQNESLRNGITPAFE